MIFTACTFLIHFRQAVEFVRPTAIQQTNPLPVITRRGFFLSGMVGGGESPCLTTRKPDPSLFVFNRVIDRGGTPSVASLI